ncbi:MAG TPA: FumA C-terminus/TtdB family hydratase beta subunit [SAR202 cluster bacterium]|jgi:fumarate hydratase class I|nr:FumA C-terminus/TtdB family hydratase beta subunit [SAR202 cluster bacterium]|tara:strand:+ start:1576 stop:2196 length:621 start_codon:yes stop_codon:yes gene_type:complete
MQNVSLPISDDVIKSLHIGDPVQLSGTMITGRDAAHKWMVETFIKQTRQPEGDDQDVYDAIKLILAGGAIYHCGPVVTGLDTKDYKFAAAGPTTSTREEIYQADVMRHFGMRAVVGKGGMGANTLAACGEMPAVYLHAIGGAAALIARTVVNVKGVHKMDFGVPEAMWVIEVENFPAVVTMDSHGNSLHADIDTSSKAVLDRLVSA